ncbi:MAG: Stk1 family PASTA domain-containing Ser/Thr kinase [Lachnospiraceae bacterium]|nr:Stk1 family PASTA domain-containing Ser/Thr kinase [Lachnospiraceae bacterium]
MIKIGMMIGDRYEILEKIGTGGMSDVYKAKDHKLKRFVAIKVLKQEFSENDNFVTKFRIEAQAAAGLMHPNIVNVYDVGEENGIYYIVMELVDGITLKKYIEKKARLTYKEAVSIAIQVSLGIEAAHNNHIIHRDIKPQNIIISKEGKVKVTDFGIAKAATSNTITSNVMGSVHYTSPEQARGGYSDEKSDIYSLGITMFEMLTGRVPFNGETTVAIAIKHIQEEFPTPREYVPEIPASVESIVIKCCQKSPDRRYQSMAELVDDLKQSLLNPDEDFVVFSDPDTEASTRFISDTEMDQIKRQSERRDSMDEALRLRSETGSLSGRYPEEDYEGEEEEIEEDEGYEDEYDPRMERITTILAVVAGIAVCCVIIFFVGRITGVFNFTGESKVIDGSQSESTDGTGTSTGDRENSGTEPVEMIAVAGMKLDEAVAALRDMGLEPEIEYMESDTYETDTVISADVSKGTLLAPGAIVKLTVSSGTEEGVELPEVEGLSYEAAVGALEEKGFTVKKTESYSADVERGNVIAQSPTAYTKAPAGSTVTVNVSLGQEDTKVRVPNLIGSEEDEAIAKLIEAGLTVGNTGEMSSEEVESGLVCYQSYSYGSYVEQGTSVDIKVSMGSAQATYRLNASIAAPTVDEAPDYVAGTSVKVTIVAETGKILLDTTTTAFPLSANVSGIPASRGTITFTYTVTTDATTVTDPDTGETVTTPGTTVEKTFTREIEFTRE